MYSMHVGRGYGNHTGSSIHVNFECMVQITGIRAMHCAKRREISNAWCQTQGYEPCMVPNTGR